MNLVKSVKKIGSDIEKGAEVITEKVSETFDNLVSHLPFSNLAKKENSDFLIEIDLPGVRKEDVNITIEDGVLLVTALRHYNNNLSNDDYYICESAYGKLQRHFILPENVNADKVRAHLRDGRLSIELEKLDAAKPKRILVS